MNPSKRQYMQDKDFIESSAITSTKGGEIHVEVKSKKDVMGRQVIASCRTFCIGSPDERRQAGRVAVVAMAEMALRALNKAAS